MRKIFALVLLSLFGSCENSTGGGSSAESPSVFPVIAPSDGAQVTLSYTNLGDVELADIATVMNGGGQRLIGGTPQEAKDWPASFTTMQGASRCTGTMIGPMVLQLAAHCVGNGKQAKIKANGIDYVGVCKHSPDYASDPTADYALCLMDKAVVIDWFEGLMLDASYPKVGMNLTLAGMGCTQAGGGGGNDNIFRAGEAPITRLPSSDNDIVTVGNSALCFGDSGGAAFIKDAKGVLKVVGINSRGDIRKTSYLSSVYTAEATSFYKSWAEANGAKICGMNADASIKCRGDNVAPPIPSPVPAWCLGEFKKFEQCLFGNPRLAVSKPQECQDTYAKLYACEVAAEREE